MEMTAIFRGVKLWPMYSAAYTKCMWLNPTGTRLLNISSDSNAIFSDSDVIYSASYVVMSTFAPSLQYDICYA